MKSPCFGTKICRIFAKSSARAAMIVPDNFSLLSVDFFRRTVNQQRGSNMDAEVSSFFLSIFSNSKPIC